LPRPDDHDVAALIAKRDRPLRDVVPGVRGALLTALARALDRAAAALRRGTRRRRAPPLRPTADDRGLARPLDPVRAGDRRARAAGDPAPGRGPVPRRGTRPAHPGVRPDRGVRRADVAARPAVAAAAIG